MTIRQLPGYSVKSTDTGNRQLPGYFVSETITSNIAIKGIPQKQIRIDQPVSGVNIDWGSSLVKSLGIEAVAIHGILYTKQQTEILTKNGSPVIAVTQTKLPSMSSNGVDTNYFKTANIFKNFDNKTKLSCFAIHSCYNNTNLSTVFSTWASPFSVYCRANLSQFELIIAQTSSGTTWASRLTSSGPNLASKFNVSRIGFTWSGGSNITPYLNGIADIGAVGYTGSPSFIQASNAPLQIVGGNLWASSPIVIIASEAWTDEQHKLINSNPWQIFQPDRRSLYFFEAGIQTYNLYIQNLLSPEYFAPAGLTQQNLLLSNDINQNTLVDNSILSDVVVPPAIKTIPQQTRISQPKTQTQIAGWIRPKDLWVPQYGKCKNLARDLDTVAKSTNSKYSPVYYGNGVGNDSNATNGRGFSTGGFTSDSGVWYTGLSEITIFAVATTPGLNGTTFNHLARLDADINSATSQIDIAVFNNAGSLRMANLLSTTTNNGWVAGSFTNVRATTSIDLSQPALYIQRWKSGTIHQAGIESIGKNSVTFVNSPLATKPSGTISVQGSSTSPMQMHIGGLALASGEFEWCGRIYLVGVLPYCISQEDANRLVQNPWQIFQPDRRSLYFFDSGIQSYNLYLQGLLSPEYFAPAGLTQQNLLYSNSIQQIQNLSAATLIQQNLLTVNNLSQSQTISNILTSIQAILTVQNIINSQIESSAILTQQNILAINSLNQNQILQKLDLIQGNILTLQNQLQTQVVSATSLIQQNILKVNNLSQLQSLINVVLTQQNVLSVNSQRQLQALSQPVFAQGSVLSTNPILQSQIVTASVLIQQNLLKVNNLNQNQSLLNTLLTQQNSLIINSLNQTQTLSQIVFTQGSQLFTQNQSQLQSLLNIGLTQQGILSVNNIRQLQSLINLTLTQQNTLALQPLYQNQQLTPAIFDQSSLLLPNNIRQTQIESGIVLTQQNTISVGNLLSNQLLSELNLVQGNVLGINSIIQNQKLDNIKLDFSVLVAVNNIRQITDLSNIALLQANILNVHGLLSDQSIKGAVLNQNHILIINDLLHEQLLNNINFNFSSNKILGKIISVVLPTETVVSIVSSSAVVNILSSGSEITIDKTDDILELL